MSRGHTRLKGNTLAPLSCHQPQPEDAEQARWVRMEGGWRCYLRASVPVINGHGLLPTDALGGKVLLDLTKAFLTFEIIWISVELFEATPSLPWPGSALPAEHPCHGG